MTSSAAACRLEIYYYIWSVGKCSKNGSCSPPCYKYACIKNISLGSFLFEKNAKYWKIQVFVLNLGAIKIPKKLPINSNNSELSKYSTNMYCLCIKNANNMLTIHIYINKIQYFSTSKLWKELCQIWNWPPSLAFLGLWDYSMLGLG